MLTADEICYARASAHAEYTLQQHYMKRYNLVNNTLGWLCFAIAAVTYLLTIEPTASFWDCPEFISQGFKLEVGHPPGNPIFMLTARFFVTIFGGGAQTAAIAVNSMSALLSAATILLLFWTVTHLVRRLVVRDDAQEVSLSKLVVIMAAGVCGALAYTWSDTFWFSAVEGEVYAFSSFCTALVFWLILKWENRADQPHSDRYLILIAYIIGVSIAVHLLNLLCIPAIVLVFYYRKFKNTNVKGSLLALAVSVVIVAFILYGLVPGFMKVAQEFELFFVNIVGMPFNGGVLIYAILLVATFVWTIRELYLQRSAARIKVGVFASVLLSGMLFIGHGLTLGLLLTVAFAVYIWGFCKTVPVRVFNVIIPGIFVIFVGYSSYALLLIRSSADTPMNQNSPDNVFALASYLNREQYGDTPLFYGQTWAEEIDWQEQEVPDGQGGTVTVKYARVGDDGLPQTNIIRGLRYDNGTPVDNGEMAYAKEVKATPDAPDRYVKARHDYKYEYAPGLMMLLPRMYSNKPIHVKSYKSWCLYENPDFAGIPAAVRKKWLEQGYVEEIELRPYINNQVEVDMGTKTSRDGRTVPYTTSAWKPSFGDNLRYFVNYQLNHMYWRYFMWNFAGRQNDLAGNGEPNLGNWISGIPFIDNARLGDQSLLPDEYGKDNPGHNVFYMLPLLLGIFGLLWQALRNHRTAPGRGIEQFWVIFFLFFMTGIAIVLYLNQVPGQPRERDYAFAGSFYAFAIWIGMGVPAIAHGVNALLRQAFTKKGSADDASAAASASSAATIAIKAEDDDTLEITPAAPYRYAGIVTAVLIGIAVPLQMVSQTWDDHDRSGRYTTRDFGANYLNSVDPDAIIFCNGDNDTFPLWYAQEVEGVRTDVKVVNLSYLSTDWYANQVSSASYEAKGVPMTARPIDYAYDRLQYVTYNAETVAGYFRQAQSIVDDPTLAMDIMTGDPMAYRSLKALSDYINSVGGLDNAIAAIGKQTHATDALRQLYDNTQPGAVGISSFYGDPSNQAEALPHSYTLSSVYVPLDDAKIVKRYGRHAQFNDSIHGGAYMPMGPELLTRQGALTYILTYDIIATSASDNFRRPVYFASTVSNELYMGFSPYLQSAGMALEVTPFRNQPSVVAQKGYANIVGKFRWGGIDTARPGKLYLDETVRRMVSSTRLAILEVVNDLTNLGDVPANNTAREVSRKAGLPMPKTCYDMARNLLDLMVKKLPGSIAPYESSLDVRVAAAYCVLGLSAGNTGDLAKGRAMAMSGAKRYGQLINYGAGLDHATFDMLARIDVANIRYNLTQVAAVVATADLGTKILTKGTTIADKENKGEAVTPDQQRLLLLDCFDIERNLHPFEMLYVHNYSDKELGEMFAGVDSETVDSYGFKELSVLLSLSRHYGLNAAKSVTEPVAKAAGVNVKTWREMTLR